MRLKAVQLPAKCSLRHMTSYNILLSNPSFSPSIALMKSQDHGREFFAALDIGTDKVLCIVARPGAEPGSMRVIGMGNARSSGVQEGCVVDVQEAVQSIRKAVQEAQYTAEVQLPVWAAIGGKYLQSANCVGQTVLRGQEVSREDVEQAESNARLAAMREGKGSTVIKLIPQGSAAAT